MRQDAAIDRQDRTRDERGLIRCQEHAVAATSQAAP